MTRLLPLAALVLALTTAFPAIAQDAAAGGKLFQQRCQMCHSTDPKAPPGLAPNLAGVAERKAGSTTYAYSDALRKSGLVWNRKTLDAFLTAPGQKVPGTRMMVSISDPKQRADIVAYLATLKR